MDIIKEVYPNGTTHRLILPQQNSFLNKASLVAELESIPPHSQLIIDARETQFIDKEIIAFLKEYQTHLAPQRNIALNMIGFRDNYDIHNYINFINVTTYDVQANLSPVEVLTIIKEGNERFLNDTPIHRSSQLEIHVTSEAQHPIAVVLGCIDSRVPVETIFDMSFGDMFCVRIAGNIINNDILASIEYACHVVGAKLVIVLGHSNCGAIRAACEHVVEGHLPELLGKIKPSVQLVSKELALDKPVSREFLNQVTLFNVANTAYQMYQKSGILKNLIDNDTISVVGATYQVETGKVIFNNYQDELAKITEQPHHPLALKMKALLEEAKLDKLTPL